MKSPRLTHTSAQRHNRLLPLLAAPAVLLLGAGRAEAILTFNIFESGPDVVVKTSGSLSLPALTGTGTCFADGTFSSDSAFICTGNSSTVIQNLYPISGPGRFSNPDPGIVRSGAASSVSGFAIQFQGLTNTFSIDPSYLSGTPIVSSATFNNRSLAGLGFTITSGPLGTWQLDGTPGPDGQINVVLGPPAEVHVPGPLPLLGGAAAFGWSRRLRRRIATAKTNVPG